MKETDIGYLIKQINSKMRAEADADMKRWDLTFSQAQVLGFIKRSGGSVTQKEIEEFLKSAHPTVVGLVQRMECKGIVETHASEKDKRIKIVSLTDRAIEQCEEIEEEFSRKRENLTRGMTAEEVETFIAQLQRINNNISRREHD